MVKSVVKPLKMGFLQERIVSKKSVFTRGFGVFRDFIMRGRCLAPKARALPTALHPEIFSYKHSTPVRIRLSPAGSVTLGENNTQLFSDTSRRYATFDIVLPKHARYQLRYIPLLNFLLLYIVFCLLIKVPRALTG